MEYLVTYRLSHCVSGDPPQVWQGHEEYTLIIEASQDTETYVARLTAETGAGTLIPVDIEIRPDGVVSALSIPMHIHALYLTGSKTVQGPMADFAQLPWLGADRDHNPQNPYLAEAISTHPFQTADHELGPGVHLHWILPGPLRTGRDSPAIFDCRISPNWSRDGTGWRSNLDILERTPDAQASKQIIAAGFRAAGLDTGSGFAADWDKGWLRIRIRGKTEEHYLGRIAQTVVASEDGRLFNEPVLRIHAPGQHFPRAPNRWLIRRHALNTLNERRWIIESDAILDPDEPGAEGAISYPVVDPEDGAPPFVRIGRVLEYDDWIARPRSSGPHVALTAIGYGETSFASFYPNCRNVFGFHDAEAARIDVTQGQPLTYDVVGWYDDPEADYVASAVLLDRAETALSQHGLSRTTEGIDTPFTALRFKELAERFSFPGDDALDEKLPDAPVPTLSFCSGRIKLGPELPGQDGAIDPKVDIAFGATQTEALSAHLSRDLPESAAGLLSVEEQLEALHLIDHLDDKATDVAFRFRSERHRRRFASVDAGKIWAVVPAGAEAAKPEATTDLPDEGVRLLDALNVAQAEINRLRETEQSLRDQVFAEWQKFMACAYPTPDAPAAARAMSADAIRSFMTLDTIPSLQVATRKREEAERTASDAKEALQTLLRGLKGYQSDGHEIVRIAETRYWRPHDPVILLAGAVAEERLHDALEHKPACDLETFDIAITDMPEVLLHSAGIALERAAANGAPGPPGMEEGDHKPHWRSFMLEWQLSFYPYQDAADHPGPHRPDFLKDTFEPGPEGVDLVHADNASAAPARTPYVISGRSLLMAGARSMLLQNLEPILERTLDELLGKQTEARLKELLGNPFMGGPIIRGPDDPTGPPQLPSLLEMKISEYLKNREEHPFLNTLITVHEQLGGQNRLRVWRGEAGKDTSVLSQALTGFNDALLMRRAGLQLPVRMPLGFTSEQEFADKQVAPLIGEGRRLGALREGAFAPLRAGHCRMEKLRVVDCFGRTIDLRFDPSAVRLPTAMTVKEQPDRAELRPRFVQPARLLMRWLAARAPAPDTPTDPLRVDMRDRPSAAAEPETSSAPSTTPVCGWLVHNHLSRNIAVFEADGKARGTLDEAGRWHPSALQPDLSLTELGNPAMIRVLRWLVDACQSETAARKSGGGVRPSVHDDFESHLARIDPEHDDAALAPAFLVGRPLAVLRLRLQLDLAGDTVLHQGWKRFAADMARPDKAPRDDDGVSGLQVPVRIGDIGLLDDGLVVCWEESLVDGRLVMGPARFAKDEPVVHLTPNGPSKHMTVVFDPRGVLHGSCGLLPVKRITVPPVHYLDALHALQIGFDIGPVLRAENAIALPVPSLDGHMWHWAERKAGTVATSPVEPMDRTGRDWGGRILAANGQLVLSRTTREGRDV